jgi:hypothetical protein
LHRQGGRSHPSQAHAPEHRRVLGPPSSGHREPQSLAFGRVAVDRCQRGMPRTHSSLRRRASRAQPSRPPSPAKAPSRTRHAAWLIAPLFPGSTDAGYGAAHGRAAYREPRHELYVLAALSEGVAKGRSLRSSSRSLMAFPSSLGAAPSLFFGARDCPLWALFAYLLTEERLTRKVRAASGPWASRLLPRRLSCVLGLRNKRSSCC